MAMGFDFRDELRGRWDTAKGFLVEQLDRLYAALAPLNQLLSLASIPANSVLTTDSAATPSFTTTLPTGLTIGTPGQFQRGNGSNVLPVGINLNARTAVPPGGGNFRLNHAFVTTNTNNFTGSGGPQGLESYVFNNQPGAAGLAIALVGNIEMASGGTLSQMQATGGGVLISGAGTVTDAKCFAANPAGRAFSGTGTFTNAYGFHCGGFGAGIANKYVLYCADPTAGIFLGSDIAVKSTTNTWQVTSDRRLKKNIAPFTDGLDVVSRLQPITYERNGLGGHVEGQAGIGLIAQDAQPAIPYCIGKTARGEETYLTLDSGPLTFVLLNAVRELAARVATLEGR